MTCEQDIRKCQQPGEDVILKQPVREALKRDLPLPLIDIEAHRADVTSLEPICHRRSVKQGSPARVTDLYSPFHPVNDGGIYDVMMSASASTSERGALSTPKRLHTSLGYGSYASRLQPKPDMILATTVPILPAPPIRTYQIITQ